VCSLFNYYINGKKRLHTMELQISVDYNSQDVAEMLQRRGGSYGKMFAKINGILKQKKIVVNL